MSEKLKVCPFCGEVPDLPSGDGTQYEIWCDCDHSYSNVQISDLMTIEERVSDNFDGQGYRYSQKYIDRAKAEAIKAWNTRTTDKPSEETVCNAKYETENCTEGNNCCRNNTPNESGADYEYHTGTYPNESRYLQPVQRGENVVLVDDSKPNESTQLELVDEIFKPYRFDDNHHLGLGDVRLTIADQERVVSLVKQRCKEEINTSLYRQIIGIHGVKWAHKAIDNA